MIWPVQSGVNKTPVSHLRYTYGLKASVSISLETKSHPPHCREGRAVYEGSALEPWAAAGIVGLFFHQQLLYILAADALLYAIPAGGGRPAAPFSLQVGASTALRPTVP